MENRQIKVIRILNRSSIGGPVLNALYLTKYMAPDFETKLICGPNREDEESADFLFNQHEVRYESITDLKREVNLWGDVSSFWRLVKVIKAYKPDIVHTHAAKAGALGRLAAFYCRVPVVVHTFHGHVFHSYFGKWKTQAYIWIERFLARLSTRIIAISDIQRSELSETFNICKPERITVVPNGIDLDKFQAGMEERRTEWRAKYGLKPEEIAVGIVGRLAPVKDHIFFTRIIAAMKSRGGVKNVRFFIIGDGECKEEIMAALDAAGISYSYSPASPDNKEVIFTSWEKNMVNAYAGMDIAVLTSLNEGTPMTLIEAHAAGLPVVSTNVGGVANVVLDNKSGYLVKHGDVDDFAEKLRRLTGDAELRRQFSTEGKRYVLSIYSYQRLVRDMKSLYADLVNK
ncbi:glycosyltransferase [Chitinophaga caseinilytica]|uniref:Glycosyltransferase n=1 Tax=Chitinophaga caseinilytica TaxID=2267521 RepID=A0ABZ2Z6Q7_9BACT